MRITTLSRREFGLGLGATAALIGVLRNTQSAANPRGSAWEKALEKITGDAKPAPGKITLMLPSTPVTGETVPIKVSVNHPMAPGYHVKAIHIFATENPEPEIASFFFTPESGTADVASRLRLNRDQDIVAVAILNTGESFINRQRVHLVLPCCEAPHDR